MKKSICKLNNTIQQALEAINNDPAGIAFIIDDNEKLRGVLTDGDIRRLLLKGYSLSYKVTNSLLGDFIYAKKGEDIQKLLKKTNKKIRIVPIVDDDMHIIDYFRYEHKTHFIPIAEPYLNGNELKYVTDAVLSTWISSQGEYIERFEKEFSDYCGVEHGVSVSNGTVAIQLVLKAMGIGQGDEVIVPDFTFAATINSVLHCGATPVIVDVDEKTWCISVEEIRKNISPKTKAIIPVHIYGEPCDMDPIMEIAKENEIFVIEDAAEAHGAEYKGRKVGGIGHASTFSFLEIKL